MNATPIGGAGTITRAAPRRPSLLLRTNGGTVLKAQWLALLVASAVSYALVARVSLWFVLEPQHVAGIWPPAGIAVGTLLVTRRSMWPAILAGIAIAVASANLMAGVPAGMTAGFVVANVFEPALGAWALRRAGFRSLATLRGVGLFLGYAAIAAPAVAAVVGSVTAGLGAGAPFLPTYVTWVLSDAGGVLAVAPMILLFRQPEWPIHSRRDAIEAVVVAALVLGLTSAAFLPLSLSIQLAASPIFLFLVLAALRFGLVGATLGTFAVAAIATAGTIAGHGPLADLNREPAVQVGQAQILGATAFLISFVTAAAIGERRAATAELAARHALEVRRAAMNERITMFARAVAATLDPDTVFAEIVRAAVRVLPADVASLSIPHGDTKTHRIVAASGAPALIGRLVEPGDGAIGAVLIDGRSRVIDHAAPNHHASATDGVLADRPLAAACAPAMVDGSVGATLFLAREDLSKPFTPDDLVALELMADVAAIALRNAVAYSRVQDDSIRDELTGVPNRRYFSAVFEQLASRRARDATTAREAVSLVLFDLDHFGAVNKEHGHVTGDRVLAAFGEVLITRLRRADIVTRYGGEEFVAVLVGTERDDAVRVANEVRAAFESIVVEGEDGEPIRCTVSAGVASVGALMPALTTLLPAADVALAMAKRAGRNMVCAA